MEKIVSNKGYLLKLELRKILKGFCYAAIGAGLGWFLQYLQAVDAGQYQVFVSMGISVLSVVLHKLFSKTEYLIERK